MKRKHVRRLFVVALIALPLQYALVGLAGLTGWPEPWPAIVLPGFQGVWDRQDYFDVPQAVFHVHFADSTRSVVPVGAVFRQLPASHHLGILRRQFMPASMSGSSRSELGRGPDTRRWLHDRLGVLFPDVPAERLDVVWYDVQYSPAGELLGAVPVDSMRIPLRQR